MARVIAMPTAPSLYKFVCREVLSQGDKVSPRGLPTIEARNVTMQLGHPDRSFLSPATRLGYHPAIGVAEGLQIIAGVSLPDLMQRVSPNFAGFREPDGHLHGAYGPRAFWQIREAIKKLKKDPDSRQAIVTIWSPMDDCNVDALDIPCTVDLAFSIRRNQLLLDVHMRSEDIWLGLPYDLIMFTMVQMTVASVLGLRAGTYTHYVNSLHAYERDVEKLPKIVTPTESNIRPPVQAVPGKTWDEAGRVALRVLQGVEYPFTEEEAFLRYCEHLLERYVHE